MYLCVSVVCVVIGSLEIGSDQLLQRFFTRCMKVRATVRPVLSLLCCAHGKVTLYQLTVGLHGLYTSRLL